ncbi:ThuA domain-containing protein [Formosa sp. L2A11]|uniref:ThuA domain-containing protein n=1 Tax=Formosa sp. L2A11 TaxID=2686363 RepID=UPI00131AAECF|nr:ThuA domain-containing protein [Formosa sp. L2A11]
MKFVIVIILAWLTNISTPTDRVLVFSKTEGYRHKSIEIGVQTLKELGLENNFTITHTEDAKVFNTTGDVLNEKEQDAFKTFINNGGSFLGVHAATDTEYNWPWYEKLVGVYFLNHPKPCEANIVISDANHESTTHLKTNWNHFDEWYNFKNISPDIHPLLMVDETSYEGGKNGDYHPVSWCQEFDGGRSFYTALGHTLKSYADINFRNHLLGGINYCLNR